MINITLSLKDGTTISVMQLAQAADAVERTFKTFMCDTSRSDPEDFRQFADEIEKKAKELARLSRDWADGLEAYRKRAESPNAETCEGKGTNPASQEAQELLAKQPPTPKEAFKDCPVIRVLGGKEIREAWLISSTMAWVKS